MRERRHALNACFFMTDAKSIEANKGGRPKMPNRQGIYSKAVKHSQKAIDTVVALLDSKNEAIRLGAAKALLDKIIPDMKAIEPRKDATPITVCIVSDGEAESRNDYHSSR